MTNKRDGRLPSQRQLRVGEEIRHALADVLHRGDFRDPELRNLNITVTEVRISPDLRNATAFITPLGGGVAADALSALRRAAPFFRAQIARAINLKFAPTIGFEADTSFDYASRISNVLHSPEVARDLQRGRNGDDDEIEYEDEDEEDGAEDTAAGDDVEYEEDDDADDDEDDDVEYEDDEDEDEDDDDEDEDAGDTVKPLRNGGGGGFRGA